MRPLDNLIHSPQFVQYKESSKIAIGFTDLPHNLSVKSFLHNHENILVERHYKDDVYLYMYVNGSLLSAGYWGDESYPEDTVYVDYHGKLTYSKSSTNAKYYIIGYWKEAPSK